jgi:hypothetical protein
LVRFGYRRSVTKTDYPKRRFVNESAGRRKPPRSVDFASINDSNRRGSGRAHGLQADALWDERTGDKNCHFFRLFAANCDFADWTTAEQRSTKRHHGEENYSAGG